MKYKVGDKVRVRKDLIRGKNYGNWAFIHEMAPLIGKYVTVTKVLEDSYNIEEDTCRITDEMLEDVEEEFKLPEDGRWCIKATKENISILGDYWDKGCGLHKVYSYEDTIRNDVGKYWCSYNLSSGNLLFSDSPGSNHIIKEKPDGLLEITFDQFKKYVLKESESTPVKEEGKFEDGKWYKILNNWWGKFETIHNSGKRIKFSESITSSGRYDATPKNIDLISEIELLTDLSEIQQYLPENHPDKIKKRTKKVEDLKYPDVVHCNSQRERNLLKNYVPKFDINNWTSEDPYLLIGGGCCSHPYEENTLNNYVDYEFSNIIFPEEKVVYKEDEEFKVGAYIVFIDSFGGFKKGDIDKICRVDSPEQIRLEKEGLCWGRLGEGFDKKCKYFLTLKEAQAFSDELLGKNKVETKPKLSKEELLAEAKRRYPVGTKYKTASDNSSDIFVLSSDDWSNSLLDDVVHAEYGKGCLYYKGDWAEIISKPTVEEEVIDVPEYIECIEGFSDYIIPGLIYKVIGKTHVDSIILRCNITSNLSAGSNLYVPVWSFAFKPSTKEAFDKQGKSGVEEEEGLVQTGMSQSQACDSCKYYGEECAKRKGCDATGGQHYPKGYISPPPPPRLEGYNWDLERSLISTEFTRLMGDICGIPSTSNDCFGPDEIYVPIIKTEVKQIKL